MGEVARFQIGAEVQGRDGSCGNLKWVVVNPMTHVVTHLAVEAKHRVGLSRLVPVGMVTSAESGIVLSCSTEEFDRIEAADELQFLPGGPGGAGYLSGEMLAFPYYGLGAASMDGLPGLGGNAIRPVVHDKVPTGEVEVRRGDRVHATDGDIGRVQGLVIDPRDHLVTHVLLQSGHLWGSKEVAIPMSAIADVDDGIRLTISKDDVRDLPPVDLERGSLG